MQHHLHYGSSAEFQLEVAPHVRVASCSTRVEPLTNLRAEIDAALARPINYPPLQLASTPGDRVVLAVEQAMRGADEIVSGTVETLLRAGVEPADITILIGTTGITAEKEWSSDGLALALPASVRAAIHIERHDPRDRKKLAYLAASREAAPIYLNRLLVDADVAVPISEVSLASSLGYLGVHGSLFPQFSDEATMQRFRDLAPPDRRDQQQQLKEQCDEVAWLLGALFTIQVVPGPNESVLHVLAGEAGAIEREAQRLAAEAWLYEPPFRASLVVATIRGGQPRQSWRNFARALFAATQAAAENSDIVLCTELASVPRAGGTPIPAASVDRAGTNGAAQEALCSDLLARTQRHSRVYLLSQLESDVVEDLGLGYVSHPDDIQRLSRRHPTWLLLEDAHNAVVRTDETE